MSFVQFGLPQATFYCDRKLKFCRYFLSSCFRFDRLGWRFCDRRRFSVTAQFVSHVQTRRIILRRCRLPFQALCYPIFKNVSWDYEQDRLKCWPVVVLLRHVSRFRPSALISGHSKCWWNQRRSIRPTRLQLAPLRSNTHPCVCYNKRHNPCQKLLCEV